MPTLTQLGLGIDPAPAERGAAAVVAALEKIKPAAAEAASAGAATGAAIEAGAKQAVKALDTVAPAAKRGADGLTNMERSTEVLKRTITNIRAEMGRLSTSEDGATAAVTRQTQAEVKLQGEMEKTIKIATEARRTYVPGGASGGVTTPVMPPRTPNYQVGNIPYPNNFGGPPPRPAVAPAPPDTLALPLSSTYSGAANQEALRVVQSSKLIGAAYAELAHQIPQEMSQAFLRSAAAGADWAGNNEARIAEVAKSLYGLLALYQKVETKGRAIRDLSTAAPTPQGVAAFETAQTRMQAQINATPKGTYALAAPPAPPTPAIPPIVAKVALGAPYTSATAAVKVFTQAEALAAAEALVVKKAVAGVGASGESSFGTMAKTMRGTQQLLFGLSSFLGPLQTHVLRLAQGFLAADIAFNKLNKTSEEGRARSAAIAAASKVEENARIAVTAAGLRAAQTQKLLMATRTADAAKQSEVIRAQAQVTAFATGSTQQQAAAAAVLSTAQRHAVTSALELAEAQKLVRTVALEGAAAEEALAVATAEAGAAAATSAGGFAAMLATILPIIAVLAVFAIALGAIVAVYKLVKSAITAGREWETLQNRLASVTGSTASARKELDLLGKFHLTSSAEMPELVDAAVRLNALGLSGQKMIDVMHQLDEAAVASGSKIGDQVAIYDQVRKAGSVTFDQLSALASTGFDLFPFLEQVTQKTGVAFYAALNAGSITFKQYSEALALATAAGAKYGSGVEAQAQTLDGVLATISKRFTAWKRDFGIQVAPALAEAFTAFDDWFSGKLSGIDSASIGASVAAFIRAGTEAAKQGNFGEWLMGEFKKAIDYLKGLLGAADTWVSPGRFLDEAADRFIEKIKNAIEPEWVKRLLAWVDSNQAVTTGGTDAFGFPTKGESTDPSYNIATTGYPTRPEPLLANLPALKAPDTTFLAGFTQAVQTAGKSVLGFASDVEDGAQKWNEQFDHSLPEQPTREAVVDPNLAQVLAKWTFDATADTRATTANTAAVIANTQAVKTDAAVTASQTKLIGVGTIRNFGTTPGGALDTTDEASMGYYNAHHGAYNDTDLSNPNLMGIAITPEQAQAFTGMADGAKAMIAMMGKWLTVTNLATGESVQGQVVDNGPAGAEGPEVAGAIIRALHADMESKLALSVGKPTEQDLAAGRATAAQQPAVGTLDSRYSAQATALLPSDVNTIAAAADAFAKLNAQLANGNIELPEFNRRMEDLKAKTANGLISPEAIENAKLWGVAFGDSLVTAEDQARLATAAIEAHFRAMEAKIKDNSAGAVASFTFGIQRAAQSWGTFDQQLANLGTTATNTLADGFSTALGDIATGAKDAGTAFKDFAASVLADISKMIIKMLILYAVQQLIGAVGSYGGGTGGSAIGQGGHSGMIVGGLPTFTREVDPAVFYGAPRYHKGGLLPGEQPIIAKKGEGIFTPQQMAALAPAGKGGGGNQTNSFEVTVNVDAASGTAKDTDKNDSNSRQDNADSGRMLAAKIKEVLVRETHPGGIIAQWGRSKRGGGG